MQPREKQTKHPKHAQTKLEGITCTVRTTSLIKELRQLLNLQVLLYRRLVLLHFDWLSLFPHTSLAPIHDGV